MMLIIDVLLTVLMLTTCVWCWLIHTRLRKLKCDRGELSEFVGTLTTATTSAEAVIKGLRTVGHDAEKKLLRQKDGIQRQIDEINHLMDASQKVIRRLNDASKAAAGRQSRKTSIIESSDLHRNTAPGEKLPRQTGAGTRAAPEDDFDQQQLARNILRDLTAGGAGQSAAQSRAPGLINNADERGARNTPESRSSRELMEALQALQ